MPNLAQLRSLLPYAVKLLPLLTGVGPTPGPQARPARPPPERTSLSRQFGGMQTDRRTLHSELTAQLSEQSGQLAGLAAQLEQLAAATTRNDEAQARLAASFQSLSSLLRGLFFAIIFLLVAITALCGLMLSRVSHS